MIIFKKVSAPVPVCVLAVCSRVCSAWSRSLTSSSKASCSLLLFLFSFFRRFWIRTEQRRRSRRTDDKGVWVIKLFRCFWYFYTRLHLYLFWEFVYYMSVKSPCFRAFLDLYIKRFEGLWRYCELGVFVVLLWSEWDIHFRVTGSKWGEYAPGSVD